MRIPNHQWGTIINQAAKVNLTICTIQAHLFAAELIDLVPRRGCELPAQHYEDERVSMY